MRVDHKFDELAFFADVKKRPAVYFGQPSLISLRDMLTGMEYAFQFNQEPAQLHYYRAFVAWYHNEILDDGNGYACWWNHILYVSGNDDRYAFERFFVIFECYLHDVHGLSVVL